MTFTEFWEEWRRAVSAAPDGRPVPGTPAGERIVTALKSFNTPGLAPVVTSNPKLRPEFILTGNGLLPARRVAGRLIREAPAAGEWRFFAGRQPSSAKFAVQFEYGELSSSAATFQIAEERSQGFLRVSAWAPGFEQLSEKQRAELTFVLLDHRLGEDAVMTWLKVDTLEAPPQTPVKISELERQVQLLAAMFRPTVAMLRAETEEGRLMLSVKTRCKPLSHLFHDQLVRVRIPIRQHIAEAHEVEKALFDPLGDDAMLIGSYTFIDKGRRETLAYVTDPNRVRELAEAARKVGEFELEIEPDPEWETYRGVSSMVPS